MKLKLWPVHVLVLLLAGFPLLSFAGGVQLAWDPSTSLDVTGYRISYGAASGQYSTLIDVGNVTTCTVSGLASGTYFFAAQAYSAAGDLSDYSNEIAALIAPPVISAVASSNVKGTSATISWTTNENSDSQVDYGTTASYGTSTTLATALVTAHSQALSGLTSNTTYHYRVKSKDAAGNLATSGDFTFATPDVTPPVISAVASSNVKGTSATISWTTNENSDSQVDYGTTASYGASTTLATALVLAHSQALSGLTSNTTYHYRVKSKDAAGNLAISGDFTFATPDVTPPVISAVASSNVKGTSATISWTTNENSDSQVDYGTTASYGASTTLATALVMAHSQTLSGLKAAMTYNYRVRSRDAAGNLAVSGNYKFTTPPAIDIYTGLVAAFSFDEGAGSTSADLSGNGNTASIYSAGWIAGRYGNALSFNGLSSYVSAGVTALPGVNQPKTISFWALLRSETDSIQSMLALANLGTNALVQYANKGNQTDVLGSANTLLLTGSLPSLMVWHYFGYVFDGSQNRMYVDGVLSATSTILPPSGLVNSFQIGRGAAGSQYFNGAIDDVRVYNRALRLDELNTAMNTPVGSDAGGAGLNGQASAPEAMIDVEEIPRSAEMALRPLSNPQVDIRLERPSYRQGETVSVDALRISNPSDRAREVEVKTWMALPGLSPISLDLGTGKTTRLAAEFNRDYEATPVLEVAPDAPAGTGEINARLLDPVTGEMLAENSKSFAIGSKSARSAMPAIVPGDIEKGVVLERFDGDSGPQYIVANRGDSEAAIEWKVWLEKPEANPIAVFSAGADGSFVLPASASMTINPMPSLQAPPGFYVLKSTILDAASGDMLGENEREIEIQ